MGALEAMVVAGLISFALIAVFMISVYKLPGVVAVISLAGQVAGTLAFVSGYFGFKDSSILTIPGIAGIILAVGMGVDATLSQPKESRRRSPTARLLTVLSTAVISVRSQRSLTETLQ